MASVIDKVIVQVAFPVQAAPPFTLGALSRGVVVALNRMVLAVVEAMS